MTSFQLLYKLGEEITSKFDQLFHLISRHAIDFNSIEHDRLLEEAKILIIKENELVSAMEIEDVDMCLNELRELIEKNFEVTSDDDLSEMDGLEIYLKTLCDKYDSTESVYDTDVLLRSFDRLKNKSYILCGEGVKLKLIQNNNDIMSYEVSVWDAVMSILNIDVVKRVKGKIDSLQPKEKKDKAFIKELRFSLECFKLTALFANFTSEIHAVCAGNNVDRIAISGIDKFKKLDILDLDLFYDFIFNEAKLLADNLAIIVNLKNNPGDVFFFLRTVTSFEVLVSYMDINSLRKIKDYCKSLTNDKNAPCMSGINNFVKSRIKNKDD